MTVTDAHIVRSDYTTNDPQREPVTRWHELVDCVSFHTDFSVRFGLPTRLALLNPPTNNRPYGIPIPSEHQYLSLFQPGKNLVTEQPALQQTLRQAWPSGPTPLLQQLTTLREYIVTLAPKLTARNQTVPIVIATQGTFTDDTRGQPPGVALRQVLQSFVGLPVNFVVRLCTDQEATFEFYNMLDAHRQGSLDDSLQFDVLDDFYNEALEVYLHNPWLCYSMVLHRWREMGCLTAEIDSLDERALTLTELHAFCEFLFGVALPSPQGGRWQAFLQAVQQVQARERQHFNPVVKRVTPWISVALLHSIYGGAAAAAAPHVPPQQQQSPFPSAVPPPTSAPQHPPAYPHQRSPTQATPQSSQSSSAAAIPNTGKKPTTSSELNMALEQSWSKQPPAFTQLQPLPQLLSTLKATFDLVESHVYFETKFHAFSPVSFSGGGAHSTYSVLKKAVRKMRLFLHPDKLPKDLTELQALLCQSLWNTLSEAWDVYENEQQQQ